MPPRSTLAPSASKAQSVGKAKSRVTAANQRKTAAASKKPTPVPERLKRLFTSLCAQIDGGHFGNAVKTCDKSAYRVGVLSVLKSLVDRD